MVETKVEGLKMVERLRRIKNVGHLKIFNNSTSQQIDCSTSQPLNTSTSDGVAIRALLLFGSENDKRV